MATFDHSRTAPGQTRTPAELAADRHLTGVWLIRDHLAALRRPSGSPPPRPGGRHRPHEFARHPDHGRCCICALPRRNAIHVTAPVPAEVKTAEARRLGERDEEPPMDDDTEPEQSVAAELRDYAEAVEEADDDAVSAGAGANPEADADHD